MKILKNIFRNIYIYFMLLVIFIVTLFLVSFAYENTATVNRYNKFLESYFNIKDVYYLSTSWSLEDNTYVRKLDISREDGSMNPFSAQIMDEMERQGLGKFEIIRNGFYQSENIGITEVKNKEEYKQILPQQPYIAERPNIGLFLNDLLGENIKFPLKEGRDFEKSDFSQEKYIPIIAGYLFSRDFELGAELNISLQTFPDEAEKEIPVKIIGFLEKDTQVLMSYLAPEIINSNNIIILGISEKNTFDSEMLKFYSGETLFGLIETKNKGEVEDRILELGREKGYEGKDKFIKLVDPTEAFEGSLNFNKSSFTTYYIIIAGSLFVSILISLLVIYLVIKKNKYVYGVLLINGARKKDIIKSISMEILLVLILADIISGIIVWKYLEFMINPIILIGYNLLIVLFFIVSSSLILKNKKIVEFIKFNEDNK